MPPKFVSIIYLLAASTIWGLSYPIGRYALEDLSPMAYSGLRFMFGSISLMPLAWRFRRRPAPLAYTGNDSPRLWLWGGMLGGASLALGSMLQLYGMTQISAGKTGFITTLYVSLVPILAFIMGYLPRALVLAGLGVGLIGLFLLTGGGAGGGFSKSEGVILAADVFWALQVLIIGVYAPKVNIWLFSLAQAATTSLVALTFAYFANQLPSWPIFVATLPVSMWGIMSAGVAYALQGAGQRNTSSTSAAMIFPFQAVVAALAGAFFLKEQMNGMMIVGASIIIGGCLVAQFAKDPVLLTTDHPRWKLFNNLRLAVAVLISLTTAALLVWGFI